MDTESDDRHDDPAARASVGPAIKSTLFWIEPRKIVLFKAIIESYDNLATLRTEDPIQHRLRLYYGIESEADVMELLDRISEEFSLRRLE